jgi:hypothetical protein
VPAAEGVALHVQPLQCGEWARHGEDIVTRPTLASVALDILAWLLPDPSEASRRAPEPEPEDDGLCRELSEWNGDCYGEGFDEMPEAILRQWRLRGAVEWEPPCGVCDSPYQYGIDDHPCAYALGFPIPSQRWTLSGDGPLACVDNLPAPMVM